MENSLSNHREIIRVHKPRAGPVFFPQTSRRFLIVFSVLVALVYCLLSTRVVGEFLLPRYVDKITPLCAAGLRLLGENVAAETNHLKGDNFSIEVKYGCDGLEAISLFLATVVAFPVPIRRRMTGAIVGSIFLFVLNLVRIVTLYLAGRHAPGVFNVLHVDVWPVLYIMCSVAAWVLWANHATRRDGS